MLVAFPAESISYSLFIQRYQSRYKICTKKLEKKRVGKFHKEVTIYSYRDKIRGIKLLGEWWGEFLTELTSCSSKDLTCIKLPGKSCQKKGGVSYTIHQLSPQRFYQRTTELAQIMYSKVQLSSTLNFNKIYGASYHP